MEVVKFQQAQLINADLDMYYAPSDTPALCRTSSLVEELGQIEFVFSDKTGTLTRNEMEFKKCSVAGIPYAVVAEEGGEEGTRTFEELRGLLYKDAGKPVSTGAIEDREREMAREFMALLAVCHTVIPEVRDGKTHYQASSPDEAALVAGAEMLGYQFHVGRSFLCQMLFHTFLITPSLHPCLFLITHITHPSADSQTPFCLSINQQHSCRIRDPQRVRVQLDTQTYVDDRANT